MAGPIVHAVVEGYATPSSVRPGATAALRCAATVPRRDRDRGGSARRAGVVRKSTRANVAVAAPSGAGRRRAVGLRLARRRRPSTSRSRGGRAFLRGRRSPRPTSSRRSPPATPGLRRHAPRRPGATRRSCSASPRRDRGAPTTTGAGRTSTWRASRVSFDRPLPKGFLDRDARAPERSPRERDDARRSRHDRRGSTYFVRTASIRLVRRAPAGATGSARFVAWAEAPGIRLDLRDEPRSARASRDALDPLPALS